MILILFLILSTLSASAAEPYAAWKYRSRIQAPEGRFVALPLSPRNLDLSEKIDLSDFRIVDARGFEVPYAVVFETELLKETNLKGTELNRERPDSSTSRITVDFRAPVTKNRITVETAGNNFRRSLRVEGSDDLGNWATILPAGWLFAAGDTPEKRFETFDVGSNTYRYVRVSVGKMPEEKEPPEIVRVSCRHMLTRKPQETAMQGTLIAFETKAGTTTVETDFGARNLPVQRIQLLLGRNPARIFYKPCEVSGRNSLQHKERIRFESGEYSRERTVETPWEHLGSGIVYRNTQGKESLALPVPSRFRYVQIRIENRDSPPLDVVGVIGYTVPAYLVFEPAGQSQFDVYTGNAAATPPLYESSKVLASLDTQTLAKCPGITFAERPGITPTAQPEGQRLVWIILVVVVLFTAWIFWNTARNIGKESAA